MKQLVFLTEHLWFGGAEVVLTDYLNALPKEKYTITLLIRDDLADKNHLLSRVPPHVNTIHLFSAAELDQYPKRMGHKAFRRELVRRVKMHLARIGTVDQIIDFSPVLDKVIPAFRKYNVVLWMHGDKSHMGFFERIKYVLRLHSYKQIVLLCEEMRTQFNQLFPSLKSKFKIIPNLFNINEILEKSNDLSDFSNDDHRNMETPYSVSVARLVPGKDFFTLIKALELIKNRGIKFRHYIIGDGELRYLLQNEIDKRGLNNNVFLLGAKKNPFPWIKNSRFFVHSAIREGFGLVIVEAMILKKAVIATNCPVGPSDILVNGTYGRLFPLQNESILAKYLEEYYCKDTVVHDFELLSQKRSLDFASEKIIPIFEKSLFG